MIHPLIKWRKERQMSQNEAAKLFMISLYDYRDWENGNAPTPEYIFSVLKAIDDAGFKLLPIFYVYKVIEIKTGKYYIGLRKCRVSPERDCYTGSGIWQSRKNELGRTLKKEVIRVCFSKKEAVKLEAEMISTSDEKSVNRQTPCNFNGKREVANIQERQSWNRIKGNRNG